jgi:hypothetical protein
VCGVKTINPQNRNWLLFICALGLFCSIIPASAEEKGGLLVDIQKKVLLRGDRNTVNGVGSTEVDRTLSLKMDVKNVTMRNMEEAKVTYTVLLQRWGTESGSIERFAGQAKLEALGMTHSGSVVMGEFHIGGHMHGSSEMHVDRLLAWKVVIERDGKPVEFVSTSSFESLNKRARAGSTRR